MLETIELPKQPMAQLNMNRVATNEGVDDNNSDDNSDNKDNKNDDISMDQEIEL